VKLTSSGDDRVNDDGHRSSALSCSLLLLSFLGGLNGCNALRQRPCGSCGFHGGCGDLMVSAKSPSAASVRLPPDFHNNTSKQLGESCYKLHVPSTQLAHYLKQDAYSTFWQLPYRKLLTSDNSHL